MRVVHYVNQFFGGLGGEEHAGTALEIRDGAVGPGKLLEQLFGGDCQVVMTLVCGDNYAVENQEALTAAVLEKIRAAQADLFVAGPCFLAGRYGMAAGALCAAVQATLEIPVITAMAAENPGADLYREFLYIVDSGDNGAKMREVLTRMAALAQKLMRHESHRQRPRIEGYLARGLIRDEFVEQTAGQRLVDMVRQESARRAIRERNESDHLRAGADAAGDRRSDKSQGDADHRRRAGAEGQSRQDPRLGGDPLGLVQH